MLITKLIFFRVDFLLLLFHTPNSQIHRIIVSIRPRIASEKLTHNHEQEFCCHLTYGKQLTEDLQ